MPGGGGVAPCKRVELSRLRWRPRQSLASSRVPSLAWCPVTAAAKRRQGGCRPERSEREDSPEIERDRSSRPCLSKGKAESQAASAASGLRCSRGSYRQHATEGLDANKGDPHRFKRKLVGSDKSMRRGGSDDRMEVRLTDSTLRTGEPATWGSGQRWLNRSWATWAPSNGRRSLLCDEKNSWPWKRNSNE